MVHLFILICSLLALVVLGTIDAVDYNLNGMLYMCHYRSVLNLLVVFFSSIFFFTVLGIVRAKRACARRHTLTAKRDTASLTTEKKAKCGTRALWFLLAAVCDTIALYVSILASSSVTSSLRSILQQASIPFSMLASYLILRRRYGWGHMLGAALIVVGIFACLATIVLSENQTSDPVWGLIFTFSGVPLALGACLKEWIMTHPKRPDDIHTVNAATVGFQLVLSLLLYPLGVMLQDDSVCLLDNSTIARLNTSQIFDNLWEGISCGIVGKNPSSNTTSSSVECGYAVLTTWLAIVTICAYVFRRTWL